jgi:hypothetical protein
MPQILVNVADDSILVVDHGQYRSLDGNVTRKARIGIPPHRTLPPLTPMPGNRIDVLGNVHITPNVRDVHDPRMGWRPRIGVKVRT